MKNEIKKLAVSGLLGGALAIGGVACSKSEEKKPAAGDNTTAEPAAAKPEAPKTAAPKTEAPKTAASKYSEIHMCAGLNSCKGLGGCAIKQEKLEALAKAAGVPIEKAGTAHECRGLNECKGLGNCAVNEEQLAKMKEKLQAKQ